MKGHRFFELLLAICVSILMVYTDYALSLTATSSRLQKGMGNENIDDGASDPHTGDEMSSADCLSCHKGLKSRYPALSEIRAGWEPATGGKLYRSVIRVKCQDCHQQSTYLKPLASLTHNVRSVGEHVECIVCHDVESVTLYGNAWQNEDYVADKCFECHKDVKDDFEFSEGHTLGFMGVTCAECHPPHKGLKASIAREMLPENWIGKPDSLATNELCLKCHGYLDVVIGNGGALSSVEYNLHYIHVDKGSVSCVECHNPHGGVNEYQMRLFTLAGERLSYQTFGDNIITCTVKCHAKNHQGAIWRKR